MAAQAIIVDGTPVAIGGGLDSISLVQPKMVKVDCRRPTGAMAPHPRGTASERGAETNGGWLF